MTSLRYLTLVWPGMPWLWLRGSLMGLTLAIAFAVSLDIAVVATWIWPGLIELPLVLGLWTATAVIWLVSAVSAASAFPSSIPVGRGAEADALFVKARAAYLARDWVRAETRLCELLELAPTDGEAQLLLGTLLRRVGRKPESRQALERLARSDCGAPWRGAIAKELHRLAAGPQGEADDDSVVLPLREESTTAPGRTAAA